MNRKSFLEEERLKFEPKLPSLLNSLQECTILPFSEKKTLSKEIQHVFPKTHALQHVKIAKGEGREHLPMRIGVVFSGGQAPGGHNVIAGLFDSLKKLNSSSSLLGFCDGPDGLISNKFIEIDSERLSDFRNQGGFDLIGSGRTKIETQAQFQSVEGNVKVHNLDGLVIIGGDDSNTNAALLAEYFCQKNIKTAVIGIPKTIDGDLKNSEIEISFGFDTACKTYAESIGNLMRDALSAKKYYYFVKLMGRSASHIAMECALQTHPNLALIGEEIASQHKTLSEITSNISDMICARALQGKDYGVILIPEGLIEFIPEVKALIKELNVLLSEGNVHGTILEALGNKEEQIDYISKLLTYKSLSCFKALPKEIQVQLLINRDAHGNVQVSKIETERLLIEMVKQELKKRVQSGSYSRSFSPIPLFCGYEGRSGFPSNFDCQYCYALGHVATLLIESKLTGYMCSLQHLDRPVEQWEAKGIPLVTMMVFEERHGESKPVIQKALVNLEGVPFKNFADLRNSWVLNDDYIYPGPIQFFGPQVLTDGINYTLQLENLQVQVVCRDR